MSLLTDRQRKALFEVVCMGQRSFEAQKISRAERKAAKWAGRVLDQHKGDGLVRLEMANARMRELERR